MSLGPAHGSPLEMQLGVTGGEDSCDHATGDAAGLPAVAVDGNLVTSLVIFVDFFTGENFEVGAAMLGILILIRGFRFSA